MSKRAFIFYGGWAGHEPDLVSSRFQRWLQEDGFEVVRDASYERCSDVEYMKSFDLIVPCWTQGEMADWFCFGISEAVANGTGLAGVHGGMCDSFRWSVEWQFITGSQWVSHPGDQYLHHMSKLSEENIKYIQENYPQNGVPGAFERTYLVEFKKNHSSPITEGCKDFMVHTEQYYLHVDPAIDVLASTRVDSNGWHAANGQVEMPVVYTKHWGMGRVFYSSLGHKDVILSMPEVERFTRRGFLWAAR